MAIWFKESFKRMLSEKESKYQCVGPGHMLEGQKKSNLEGRKEENQKNTRSQKKVVLIKNVLPK
jgi:hypothetical protein